MFIITLSDVFHKTSVLLRLPLAIVLLIALSMGPNAASADVKVAFIGDQGVKEKAQLVLQLIRDEGAQLLLIQGDLGYSSNRFQAWESNLDENLGKDFPILTVIGNHEDVEWPEYQALISARIDRIDELSCAGNYGVKAFCSFRGLEVAQVAPGIYNTPGVLGKDNYDGFIKDQFANSQAPWRICSWHKNQKLMQVGAKNDGTGWGVYQACLQAGAIVATGHEHSYSRTHLMSDFKSQSVANTSSHLVLEEGRSFVFVSGLGGREIREQLLDGDWWAVKYTSSQQASPGALFCTFGSTTADCYFKDINGAVPDTFTLESKLGQTSSGRTDPVESDSVNIEPEAAEPEAAEPEVVAPEVVVPEVVEPEVVEPEVVEPEAVEPEVVEPEVVVPEVVVPEVVVPEVVEPEVVVPEVVVPEVVVPEVVVPEAVEPEVVVPEVVVPEAVEPEVVEPEVVEPEVVEPEAVEPEAVEPEAVVSEVVVPEVVVPEVVVPEVVVPEVVVPEVVELVVTEPEEAPPLGATSPITQPTDSPLASLQAATYNASVAASSTDNSAPSETITRGSLNLLSLLIALLLLDRKRISLISSKHS